MSAQPTGPRRRVSLAQAREQLPALVHDVAEHGPVELTSDGEAVALLVPVTRENGDSEARPDLWTALQKFRESVDLDELGIDDSFLEGIRDPSPGRDIEL